MRFILTLDIDELPGDLEYDMRRLFQGFAETVCGRKWEPYNPKANTREILNEPFENTFGSVTGVVIGDGNSVVMDFK